MQNTDIISPPPKPKVVAKAYNQLNYSAGYVTKDAAAWFAKAKVALPKNFTLVTATPVTKVITVGHKTIGLVFFPKGETMPSTPTPRQVAACIAAAKELAKKTSVVIGVSPWGLLPEKEFLSNNQGVFACLLGGGDGIGFAYSLDKTLPATLWVRSDAKGKAVTVVDIYKLPTTKDKTPWVAHKTFAAELIYLDQKVPFDPTMTSIIGSGTKQ